MSECYFELKVYGAEKCRRELISIFEGCNSKKFAVMEYYQTFDDYDSTNVCTGLCKNTMLTTLVLPERNYSSADLTNLLAESRDLELRMEGCSNNSEALLAERFVIEKGLLISYECRSYEEYYWDKEQFPTLDDYNRAHNTNFKEEDFKYYDNGTAIIVSFEDVYH